jgi:hypothetical protein
MRGHGGDGGGLGPCLIRSSPSRVASWRIHGRYVLDASGWLPRDARAGVLDARKSDNLPGDLAIRPVSAAPNRAGLCYGIHKIPLPEIAKVPYPGMTGLQRLLRARASSLTARRAPVARAAGGTRAPSARWPRIEEITPSSLLAVFGIDPMEDTSRRAVHAARAMLQALGPAAESSLSGLTGRVRHPRRPVSDGISRSAHRHGSQSPRTGREDPGCSPEARGTEQCGSGRARGPLRRSTFRARTDWQVVAAEYQWSAASDSRFRRGEGSLTPLVG